MSKSYPWSKYSAASKQRRHEYRQRWASTTRNGLLIKTRMNAKHRGIEFDLTLEDMPEIPDACPILHIPLNQEGVKDSTASVDRTDSSKGYVKGNIQIISWRANNLKKDMTKEECELLWKWFAKTQGEEE